MYFNHQGGMCENVQYFDSHALLTINAINVPHFYRSCLLSHDIWDFGEHAEVEHG